MFSRGQNNVSDGRKIVVKYKRLCSKVQESVKYYVKAYGNCNFSIGFLHSNSIKLPIKDVCTYIYIFMFMFV